MNKGNSESWKFLKEVYDSKNLPFDSVDEFVFWGRSNVGKSSLINSLTNTNLAKVSRTPGRTKSLIFYELEGKIRLVDFPGYGFSKISKDHAIIKAFVYFTKMLLQLIKLKDFSLFVSGNCIGTSKKTLHILKMKVLD